jgi:CheY-like chemotaxis protein
MLTKAGYKVLAAADGEEALRAAQEHTPDLVLLDMMLPKLSGPEVLHQLKRSPATSGIPVIVVSGLSRQNEAKLKKAGAAAYLEKADLTDELGSTTVIKAIEAALLESGCSGKTEESASSCEVR